MLPRYVVMADNKKVTELLEARSSAVVETNPPRGGGESSEALGEEDGLRSVHGGGFDVDDVFVADGHGGSVAVRAGVLTGPIDYGYESWSVAQAVV